MSQVSGSLPRPKLRGLLHSVIKRNLVIVGVSVVLAGAYMKFVQNDGRKAVYANFYKNYDIVKEFETMRKKGLFDSCPSD